MSIKNIFFDFDGVLAESVSAKTNAFKEMYLPYGEDIANQVIEYHLKNGGVSRFEKFKYWEKTFLGRDITENRIKELADEFSNLVLEKVIKAKEVPFAKEFLKKHSQNLKFWIITGTPSDEIDLIAKKRDISQYFIGIYGSPNNKKYWTEYLITTHNLKREETLFLGDATTDIEAAEFSKIHFALRENNENKKLFSDYKGPRFKDFFELETILKNSLL